MFVEGYYLAGEEVKAQTLTEEIVQQYEGRFGVLANLSQSNQQLVFDRIKEEVLNFRELVNTVIEYDNELADTLQLRFDQSMDQFKLDEQPN